MSSTAAFRLQKLQTEYGARALDNEESRRPTARGFKIANGRLGTQARALNERCSRLKERISALPNRVSVGEAEGETIVSLDPETKHLTGTIKTVAYRAETAFLGLVGPAYARTEEEGRALLRKTLRAPTVRFLHPESPSVPGGGESRTEWTALLRFLAYSNLWV